MSELIDDGMLNSEWCNECHKAYCECGHRIEDTFDFYFSNPARWHERQRENPELRGLQPVDISWIEEMAAHYSATA